MATTENAAEKQRGRPFPKGVSGNPRGKPPGTRNRYVLAAEALLEGESEKLTRKAVELALDGNLIALRICLERLLPSRRERPLLFNLPRLTSASDAVAALSAIAEGVAHGELTDGEARTLVGLVDCFREVLATVDLEARLSAVEQQIRGSIDQ